MHTVHLSAITMPDGTVSLTVPTGVAAGERVDVEVRIGKGRSAFRSKKQWQEWVRKMAGSITDSSFQRPEQPPLDDVEPL